MKLTVALALGLALFSVALAVPGELGGCWDGKYDGEDQLRFGGDGSISVRYAKPVTAGDKPLASDKVVSYTCVGQGELNAIFSADSKTYNCRRYKKSGDKLTYAVSPPDASYQYDSVAEAYENCPDKSSGTGEFTLQAGSGEPPSCVTIDAMGRSDPDQYEQCKLS